MGSVEVYDYQQQKWVPYVGDPEVWYQHFKDLRDGYVQPDHRGRYIVGSGSKYRKQPTVNLVTPVAQANAIAQSEVDREKQRKNTETQKRKNVKAQLPKPKRQKTKYDSDDIFSL